MENRSHALIAGLFTLVLLVFGIAVAVWLNRDNTGTIPYDLETVESVQGLTAQADVRYRGLLVGKVDSIRFDPVGDGTMLVRISVHEGTPITDTLKATVEMKGVTGIAYVDLDDEGVLGKPLSSSESRVARIRMQPGLTERVLNRASELMEQLAVTGAQLNQILGPQNQQAFAAALQNSADMVDQLHTLMRQMEPVIADVRPLLQDLSQAANKAGDAANAFSRLAGTARTSLDRLSAPGGLLDEAGQSLLQLRRAAARLAEVTPSFGGVADQLGSTARTADRTLKSLGRSPQSVLFGPAPARPGPGEPGFAGFRNQP